MKLKLFLLLLGVLSLTFVSASFIVSFGEATEFAGTNSQFNNVIHIINETYVNVWTGSGNDGNMEIFTPNTTKMTVAQKGQKTFDSSVAVHIDAIRVEEFESNITDVAHIFAIYRTNNGDGDSALLEINLTSQTLQVIDTFSFSDVANDEYHYFSIARIDDNHFFVTYKNRLNDGYHRVFLVNSTTIANVGNEQSFSPGDARYNSLVYLNDSGGFAYFFNSWSGEMNDGFGEILKVNKTSYSRPTGIGSFEFDSGNGQWNNALRYNDSIVINTWESSSNNGKIGMFIVNYTDDSISAFSTATTFSTGDSQGHGSLVKINQTRYALASTNVAVEGEFRIFNLNQTDWTFTEVILGVFDNDFDTYNSLLQIGDNTDGKIFFINANRGLDNDGYVRVFQFDEGSCDLSVNGGLIDCSYQCSYSSAEDFSGNISMINYGLVTFLDYITMTDPFWYVYREDSCSQFNNNGGFRV